MSFSRWAASSRDGQALAENRFGFLPILLLQKKQAEHAKPAGELWVSPLALEFNGLAINGYGLVQLAVGLHALAKLAAAAGANLIMTLASL